MNFFKLSPRRTQGEEGSERGRGKKLKQVRCPPGEKRRRKERIDMNEGKGSNLESTWQEERVCRDFRLIGYCMGREILYFTKISNESGTKCEPSRGVILSVHYCALRHCALFYVRYYRLGAAGDDARGVLASAEICRTRNERSSMNSKVPPHHTTTQQREEDVSIHAAGKEVFLLHIKALSALKRRF